MGVALTALTLLATALSLLLACLYLYFQKNYRYWSDRNIIYAKPHFPVGNLKDVSKRHIADVLRDLYLEFKDKRFFGFWQLHRPNLMINDPELIKSILVGDFMSFHDHGVYVNEKEDPLSVSLFSLGGTKWRNLRAKLTPTFTSGKMKMMFPIMAECGEELKTVLRKHAEREEVVEVKEYSARYSTDIIASCAFGIQSNSLRNPDSIFRTMGRKVFEPTWSVLIKNFLMFLLPDVAELLKLVVTPKDVSEFFLGAFKETMDYREANDIKRNDMLQLLIQLKTKGFIDDVDSRDNLTEKEKFTFELAAAQAFIFFVGGFETSSTTTQFALYELARNPEIQDRLRREIRQVLAKHEGKMTYEAVFSMDLLGRVIDEVLRKYPPGPVLSRICTKDYKVPGTDIVLEKNTPVTIPVFGLHMDERYFPEPEKFDPDRFTEEQKHSRHHYVYLPFGEGPRVCIGQRFAMMQTRVGLVSLLSSYKFDVSPEHTPIPIQPDPKSFIYSPKGGMNLQISLAED